MKTLTLRKTTNDGNLATWKFTKGACGDFYAVNSFGKRIDFMNEEQFEACIETYTTKYGFSKRAFIAPTKKVVEEASAS